MVGGGVQKLELIRHDLFQSAVWACAFSLPALWSPRSNTVNADLLKPCKNTNPNPAEVLQGCHPLTHS